MLSLILLGIRRNSKGTLVQAAIIDVSRHNFCSGKDEFAKGA
jgi:hypothetical protein